MSKTAGSTPASTASIREPGAPLPLVIIASGPEPQEAAFARFLTTADRLSETEYLNDLRDGYASTERTSNGMGRHSGYSAFARQVTNDTLGPLSVKITGELTSRWPDTTFILAANTGRRNCQHEIAVIADGVLSYLCTPWLDEQFTVIITEHGRPISAITTDRVTPMRTEHLWDEACDRIAELGGVAALDNRFPDTSAFIDRGVRVSPDTPRLWSVDTNSAQNSTVTAPSHHRRRAVLDTRAEVELKGEQEYLTSPLALPHPT